MSRQPVPVARTRAVACRPAPLPAAVLRLPGRADRPGALLRRPGRATRSASSSGYARPGRRDDARRRRRPRATSATRSRPRARRTSRSTPTSASCPGTGDIASGHRDRRAACSCRSRDDAVDVCYSSNVLEHVPDPWRMAEEMLRVTRPGGVAFISYTVWYGPWGGHETAPWHFLGGAARPPALRRQARPRAQEQVRRVAVRGHREAGARLGAPAAARRGPRRDPALQPAVELLAAQGAGPSRGGDVEPRDRAARPMSRTDARRARGPDPGAADLRAAPGRVRRHPHGVRLRPVARARWSRTPSSTW